MFTLTSAAVVAAVALLVPITLQLLHLPVPSIVAEIVLGIAIGPQVLGWARVDEPVAVLSTIGLAFLLFLSGLEIEFDRLRGRILRLTLTAFVVSFVLAVGIGELLGAGGLVRSPLLIAVILSATSLGIVLPILKDSGQVDTQLGQVIVAAASIAEVVPVVLLSLLFSEHGSTVGAQVVLFAAYVALVVVVGLIILGVERSHRISRVLIRLQETTAEIRIRGAFGLLILFACLAARFGLEAILGAFLAGVTLKLVDRDREMTHALFRVKLQATGFGVFIPFFFVSTGMNLNVRALVDHPATLARVPVFLAALLIVRAVPVIVYRRLGKRPVQLLAVGLLQATSLSIPVVAGAIGVDLGLIPAGNYAALVAAGLLSVIVFPLLATPRLRESPSMRGSTADQTVAAAAVRSG